MSAELSKQKGDFEKRMAKMKAKGQKTTVVDDLGHFAIDTNTHRNDAMDANNTGAAELAISSRRHGRKNASRELTKASDSYKKRMQAPAVKKFKLIDTDGNGSLDLQEILAGASILDLTEDQARAWFHELDVDNSGDVDMDEFLAGNA